MDNINWAHATDIPTSDLPAWIPDYLAAHQARDLDTAIGYYIESATVTDEGRTYRGREAIREWLATSATQYTYTTELVRAARLDDQHFDAVHHLEGNFPGGTADLHFRFTVSDHQIADLVVEP